MRVTKYLLLFILLAGWGVFAPYVAAGAEWKILKNCTYVPNDSANDGDSFWLQHKRTKMKIRLYFVDCPESTDDEEWAVGRLKDQAEYFNSDAEGMLRTGIQAKKYAQKLLSGKDGFTVYTRMQTAMGRGKTRYYAMVEVDGRFLSEWLTENGLVRINKRTMISGPLPNKMSVDKYEQHLRKLEQQAKRDELGGWGRQVGRARNKVAKILEGRGESTSSAPEIPTGVVVLKRNLPVYSLLVPGKLVRLLRPNTKIKVTGPSEDAGMAIIRFNTERGIIYEAQCQTRDLQ